MEAPVRFKEQQHFRQLWLWALLFLFSGFVMYLVIKQTQVSSQGEEAMKAPELLIAVAGMLTVVALFVFARLDTIVKDDGIYYKFFPFHLTTRKIEWSQISKVYVRKYNAITEYGGWGIRIGIFGKGRAFNVSGNRGLQLELTNGKKILIGTNRPEELERVIHEMTT